ncbi:MAG: Sec-independent protein translocase protein TatB [Hyphomicrobiaceae bacterium]
MFDLTSSKLLILAVVALVVVGPKDLPALLRTVGRYLGMIRRQANDFRSQFEDAMRESELADLKKEVETLGNETSQSLREATSSIEDDMRNLNSDIDDTLRAQTHVASDSATPAVADSSAEADPGAIAAEATPPAPTPPVPATPRPVAGTTSDSRTPAAAGADTSHGGA